MMEVKETTKIVEVAGQRWQLRRMSPVDGSYCWQRLMAAMFRSASAQPQMVVPADEAEELRMKEAIEKATPEDRLRTTCGVGFMHLTYDELKFMQRVALAVTSRMEDLAGADTPMPVVTEAGNARVASRNSTGEVNCRESRSRHSSALVCTRPSTLAISTASVAPHVTWASARSSSFWAGSINGEWNAPPTANGVARRQPSSR